MAQGRKTGGRQKGTPNRKTLEKKTAIAQMTAGVLASLDAPFAGDAHALLMLVYKDQAQPMEMRLEAAKSAIRFEKPSLAAIDVTADATVQHVISAEPLSPAERDAKWLEQHGMVQ